MKLKVHSITFLGFRKMTLFGNPKNLKMYSTILVYCFHETSCI